MRHSKSMIPLIASLMLTGPVAWTSARAQTAAESPAGSTTLSGLVSSTEEGPMGGVLVSAKRTGSPITITVVTDDKGRYSFPAGRLEPGAHAITIRAAGFVLNGAKSAELVADKPGVADITLAKTRKLSRQISNGEWLMSAPGQDKQKEFLTQCVGCHTLHRVFSSSYTASEFQDIFQRMSRYSPGSTPTAPQPLLPGPRGERPAVTGDAAKAAAAWLASVNLSDGDVRDYALKTLPRPKGRSTRVVITEYDLPRKSTQPHDVIVDKQGRAWYSDFGNQFIGEMDIKTGKVIDHAVPVLKPEQPKGGLDVEFDPDGNVWLSMMYQAGIARIDTKTKAVTTYPFPSEWQSPSTQASMVSAAAMNVDGKVWTNNQEDHYSIRLDVKSGKYDFMQQNKDKSGKIVRAYGMPVDKTNSVYLLEFGGMTVGRRDAKTGDVQSWRTATPGSRPRRGRVDDLNRLWFAEYGGNAIARFNFETGELAEWQLPRAWSAPYDVATTKNGDEAWTGSMLNDLVYRLNAKTGEITEYLLPRTTNIRRVFVEEGSPRPVLWVGSNHGASIVKVEPLE